MLTVSVAATQTALTTLETFKLELGIDSTADDVWLRAQIEQASAQCCSYLGVPQAIDGSMRLGRETLVETIRLNRGHPRRFRWDNKRRELMLSRWPVSSISSIVVDDVTLAADEYEISDAVGTVLRLNSDLPSFWTGNKIVVTYVGGWVLPGMVDGNGQALVRNLPQDHEQAVILILKQAWFARARDPSVKSEDTPGAARYEYFFGAPGQDIGMPIDAAKLLDDWRY